jgi:hypothetical protein
MLPTVLLEILYKVLWLLLVAYPLWSTNQLIDSPAEKMTVTSFVGCPPNPGHAMEVRI